MDGTIGQFEILYYVAKHGLKNLSLTGVQDLIFKHANVHSPGIVLIELHLASVISLADHAVMLRKKTVTSIVSGPISYYCPFLYNYYCHFSGGHQLFDGPSEITGVRAYDPASHMYKGKLQGSLTIVAILGKFFFFFLCYKYLFK